MSDRPTELKQDPEVDQEALLAEYEAEKPARALTGIPFGVVQVLGAALAALGLWWVFNPISKQLYLPLFAMLMLATTFLVYRGWGRSSAASEEGTPDQPHPIDWLLVASRSPPSATSRSTGRASSAARSHLARWSWWSGQW